MSKKIIILTIPGIGTKEPGYSKPFEEDLHKHLKNSVIENNIRIEECLPFKETNVDKNQKALFDRFDNTQNKLGGILSLRKLVIEAFGDAVTFESKKNDENSVYQKVHKYLKGKIEEVNNLADDNTIIAIVAGSLGAHILSSYIWDADKGIGIFTPDPATESNNLRNLVHLSTIGCNIPLFVSGMEEHDIMAFEKRNENFTWDNYYDKDDVLGWPLKDLSPSYKSMVEDVEINTGLYIGAHLRYWKDNDFTESFAARLIEIGS